MLTYIGRRPRLCGPNPETEMTDRLETRDLTALVQEAHALRAACIRDTFARIGQWFARSLHLARPAH